MARRSFGNRLLLNSLPIRRCVSLLMSLAVAGCHATLNVMSQPEGALVTEIGTGTAFGVTPVSLSYDLLSEPRGADGCYRTKGLSLRWASGASAALPAVLLCGGALNSYEITFSRPLDYPGLDRDLMFALQAQGVRAQVQAAKAAQDAVALAALVRMFPVVTPSLQCSSVQIGFTVTTTCR